MSNPVWRILIVDDEAPARRILRELLEERDDVLVLGEAGCVETAEAFCRSEQPNLLLLDIQLAHASGFDLLEKLDPMPNVIFVTAFDHYAVKAFDVAAVDYLMKPVVALRLDQALTKAGIPALPGDAKANLFLADDRVYLPCNRQMVIVEIHSITCVQADGNFSKVHMTHGDVHFVSRNFGEWSRRLPDDHFIRLDRSTLVNVKHIKHVKMIDRDEGQVWMTGSEEGVTLGRTALARIRELLRG